VGLSFGVLVVNTKFGVSGVLFSKEEVLLFPFLPTLGVYPFPLAASVYAPCRGYAAPLQGVTTFYGVSSIKGFIYPSVFRVYRLYYHGLLTLRRFLVFGHALSGDPVSPGEGFCYSGHQLPPFFHLLSAVSGSLHQPFLCRCQKSGQAIMLILLFPHNGQ